MQKRNHVGMGASLGSQHKLPVASLKMNLEETDDAFQANPPPRSLGLISLHIFPALVFFWFFVDSFFFIFFTGNRVCKAVSDGLD